MVTLASSNGASRQISSMRMAEQVADVLRRRILASDFVNGSMLPKQDELVAEFGVSYPSVREALRILEAEGLISIRRGNLGGAQVHAPDAATAGYAFGLALQAMRTPLSDLAEAIAAIEPLSAARCARRSDRKRKVVPRLRELIGEAEAAIGDEIEFARAGHALHEAIMSFNDSATERLIVRSLDALWSVQEEDWAAETARTGRGPSAASEPANLMAVHTAIVDLIDDGDADGVEKLMREHVRARQRRVLKTARVDTVDAASPRTRLKLRGLSRDAH